MSIPSRGEKSNNFNMWCIVLASKWKHWFVPLQEAQLVIEAWHEEYRMERMHSSIGA